MDLTRQVSFRTAGIVVDRVSALSHDDGIKYSELMRLAFSYGVNNAQKVFEEKREGLSLEQALVLQSCGVDYK